MPQPDHISALPVADPEALAEDLRELFALCTEKLGIVPNVLRAYSLRPQKLRNFVAMYNELMLAPSGLSKLEREMVAVVVSRSGGAAPVRRPRTRRDAGHELSGSAARHAPARDARFRVEADHGSGDDRRGGPGGAAPSGSRRRGHFRPHRNGRLLQHVEPNGQWSGYHSEPRVSPVGPVTRAAAGPSAEVFLATKPQVVLRGLDPRIHAFVSGARRRGWPGQARPGRIREEIGPLISPRIS